MKRIRPTIFIAILSVFLTGAAAESQQVLRQPISFAIPVPPGGPYDAIARYIARSVRVGENTVIVESKPGAGSMIATRYVLQAPPDGRRLLFAQSDLLGPNTLRHKDAGFVLDDLTPVSPIATYSFVLYVNEKLPVSNLKELVEYAAGRPGQLNLADFGGILDASQVLISELQKAGNIKFQQVSYKGAPDMIAAMMSNDVQLMFLAVGPSKAFLESGRLKAIAIARDERSPLLPNVPTFRELGMPSVMSTVHLAFFARAETPAPALDELRNAIGEVVETSQYREFIASIGFEPWRITPGQLKAFVKDDFLTWKRRWEARADGNAAKQ